MGYIINPKNRNLKIAVLKLKNRGAHGDSLPVFGDILRCGRKLLTLRTLEACHKTLPEHAHKHAQAKYCGAARSTKFDHSCERAALL